MASPLKVASVARTRPRDRDIEALAFIGRGYEVAQYQLHEAIFALRSPNVVSRFVIRASERGFIAAERLGGIGMNRLRLTRRGREFLIGRGIAEDELFAPTKAVALKDVAHTLAINDLRVALMGLGRPPASTWPAWFLERRLLGAPAVPDLLARWASQGSPGLLVACEIDLGREGLQATFLPKLSRLMALLHDAASWDHAVIAVFTRGAKRAAAIGRATALGIVKTIAAELPSQTGSPSGIQAFRTLLTEDEPSRALWHPRRDG